MDASAQILNNYRPIIIDEISKQSGIRTSINKGNGVKSATSFKDIFQQMVGAEGSSVIESMGMKASAVTPPSTPGITPPSIPGITPPVTPGIMPPNTPGITPTSLFAEIAPPCTPPGIVPPGTPPGITPPSTPGNTPPNTYADNAPPCTPPGSMPPSTSPGITQQNIFADNNPPCIDTEQNPASIKQHKKYSPNELSLNALPGEDVLNSSNSYLKSFLLNYQNNDINMLFESLKYQPVLSNKNEGFKFFG